MAPAYFADKIQLGGMMQTASAFGSVQEALSFFVSTYRTLAEWRAGGRPSRRVRDVDRKRRRADGRAEHRSHVGAGDRRRHIDLGQLLVSLPNGTPLVAADGFSIRGNERTLVTGPSGAGKSTLFRAIAGIWPFGTRLDRDPRQRHADDAAAAAVFPGRLAAGRDRLSRRSRTPSARTGSGDALAAVGLPQLAARLEEEAHWNRMLSLGEQQRLGLARALLHAPQYLFLDEATASLDEASEAALYQLLEEKLPATTIVSIGHRSTLEAFHQRNVALTRDGDRFALQDRSESVGPA